MYFVKKLYKSLRVPTNRLEPDSSYEDSATILREELKFARFVIRLQRQFAAGIKSSFITHLKLKKLWEKYELKEHHFDIKFNPPSSFYTLREQQILDLKQTNFGNMSQSEFISTTFSMKKYLDWSDVEVKQNREWLKKDAALQFEISQIASVGPNWRDNVTAEAGGEGVEPPMGGMAGGSALPASGGDLAGTEPPEFGGAAEAPVGGGEASPVDTEGGGSELPPA
jgi:mannose/fructose/N-acetylgalactosamine-specific phosphotransferase system component IIB